MRTAFSVMAALLIVFTLSAQTQSVKRGICGDASPGDLASFAPYIAWYYNWSIEPPAVSKGELSGIEWVPMQWGAVSADKVATIASRIPEGSKYLLGFNEPNFKSQSNLTPAQAAAMWPHVETIAREKGLALVSPAVNWCGDCVDGVTNDPVDWLDKFIAACPDCRFDYIAVHNYNSYLAPLKSYLKKFAKYGKPLWLTEFAPWDDPVDSTGVVNYMKEAVPYLENEPLVYRYAWFATRVKSNPDIDLLDADGKLTKLGQLYATLPFRGDSTAAMSITGHNRADGRRRPVCITPCAEYLTIAFPATPGSKRLTVFDCSGKTVYSKNIDAKQLSVAVATRTFVPGVSIITVGNNRNRMVTQRMVKMP
jgi:hypothetical protein